MIISHPAIKEYQRKPLAEHLANVAKGSRDRIQRLSLSTKLISKENFEELAFRAGLLHDIGKASTYFQDYIRGGNRTVFSNHSLISAILLYYVLADDPRYREFALIAFKAVQRHHGNLSSFGSERLFDLVLISNTLKIYESVRRQIAKDQSLSDLLQKHSIFLPSLNKEKIEKLGDELEEFEEIGDTDDAIERFLIQNLLFSVLLDADKHDAARIDYKIDQHLHKIRSYSPSNYVETFDNRQSELNIIRSRLLKAASEVDPDSGRCFAMSAPTGSGKTLACLGFADALFLAKSKKRRLIYCLPYTSIIDQNFDEIDKVLSANGMDAKNRDLLLKHHHLVDFSNRFSEEPPNEDYNYHDYLNDTLIADSWNAACVVSSFVQLFHSLIGSKNSLVRKLHNIVNSIILLDEVQSLPPKYYPLLRRMFYVLANRFDTYILTCTATQPFIYEPDSFHEISPPSLFDHDVFNRVSLEIVREPQSLEDFAENLKLEDAKSALFVMNTKKSANTLYRLLSEKYGDIYDVYCLTTYHVPAIRLKKIKEIKELLEKHKPLLLVSTQLIEAGVDLSFQKAYRDKCPLDSIIQVAGRCNRHSEFGVMGGNMQLLNLNEDGRDYASRIYDKYLLQKTDEAIRGLKKIENKDFEKLIKSYYHSLEFQAESNAIMRSIQELNYDQNRIGQLAIDKFRLIEDSYATTTLYIPLCEKAEIALENLIRAQNELSNSESLDEDTESELRFQIKKSYHMLSAYQLNLHHGDLKHYDIKMSYFNKLNDSVYYISPDGVENTYDNHQGLILEPDYRGAVISI
ncbi:MAG TPA: CRISPR-associated helicase Cas3' [Candidatus Cloacimonetes bacterium]|nr:CRISPR-associated helicase Cas3' [Candidatus Cloacimonadota bacterium]